ncbi:hypothetical protein MPSEU_000344500 [Mayamaea pseudoterrestris]|nr:hypothetical protein MPSEU_000344500 [Mayamaea pseudoterrestris]
MHKNMPAMTNKFVAVVALVFSSTRTVIATSSLPINPMLNHETHEEESFHPSLSILQRALAFGDFSSLNTVLQSVQLDIDESPTITETLGGSTLTITLDNITCSQLQLGDVTIDWEQEQTIAAVDTILLSNNVTLKQVDLDCSMAYTYSYLFFSGGGGLNLITANNTIVTNTDIVTNAAKQPPLINVNMTSCRANIQIEDMQFDGDGLGLLGSALNTVEGLVRTTVADKMQAYLCSFLGQFQAPLQSGLSQFTNMLEANATAYQPLLVESNMKVPRSVNLLDLQNPQASTTIDPQIIQTLIDQVSAYLSAPTNDGELNLNRLLQDSLLDENGSISVDLTALFGSNGDGASQGLTLFDNTNDLGDYTLIFTSARIKGLDSFTKIDPLRPIGKHTLESSMTMDRIAIQLDAELEVKTDDKSLSETFVMDISLSDISLSTALLLGIDMNTLGQLPLGAFMDMANILPCMMTSIYRLKGTGLDISTMTVEAPTITGFTSPGLQRIMSEGLEAIFAAYNPLLSESLPNLVESTVVDMLDKALSGLLDTSKNTCLSATPMEPGKFVDFRDLLLSPLKAKEYGASGASPYGELAVIVKQFVDDQLLRVNNETGRTGLAEMFIVPMTKKQSGTAGSIVMKDIVSFAGTIDVGEESASLALNVRDVGIDHLDSIGLPLVLLDPVRNEANLLNNTITLGVTEALLLQGKVLIDIEMDDEHIHNDVSVSVGLQGATAFVEMLMKLSEQAIMTFPLQDLFVWDCWLASIPSPTLDEFGLRQQDSDVTLSLPDLAVSIASMNFTVDCTNCSSTKMEEFAAMISSATLHADVVRSATNVVNTLVKKMSGRASFLQTTLDRLVVDAARFCPHSPEYDLNATKTIYSSAAIPQDNSNLEYMIALLATMIVIAIILPLLYLSVRTCVRKRHRSWLSSLSKEQILVVYENQTREKEDEAAVNNGSRSLFRSFEIPAIIRWFAPVALLGNIALFLTGHLSKGGTVELHIDVGGQKIAFTDFYTFSIAQSGIELWNAGYKPLAMLMLIVSGVWPYAKQLITIILWFLPPKLLSTKRRGSILLVLDFLAKWSMVDVFVMIVCLAAFRVQITSPDLSFVPDALYQIDIMVVPVWGLYANMLAQIVSQLTSHFIIGYHRLAVFNAQKHVECERRKQNELAWKGPAVECEAGYLHDGTEKENDAARFGKVMISPTHSTSSDSAEGHSHSYDDYPLSQHQFTRPHRGELEKLVVRRGVNIGIVCVSLATSILVIVGCSLPSVSFDYQGIVGVAVESGQDFMPAKEYISVFSLIQLMMQQAQFLDTAKDTVGMLSVSLLLLLSTLFVPLTLMAVLLVEWFKTHSLTTRRRLRSTVEILQAWQYIEVFVLSLIVGAWQIGDVSELLLDDYCGGSIGGTLSELASFNFIKPEDAKCFRVQAAIESGSFVLVAAGVLIIFLSLFMMMAVNQRTQDEKRSGLDKFSTIMRDVTEDEAVALSLIDPAPVLFTDQFRWFLVSTGKCEEQAMARK